MPASTSLGNKPATVKVASLLDGKLQNIKELNIEEFERQHGMVWVNSVVVNPINNHEKIQSDNAIGKKTMEPPKADEIVKQDDLIVVDMGEVGHGVFLSPEAQPIEIGTDVTYYCGELKSINSEKGFLSYAMNSSKNLLINAERYGNVARFVQHAPTLEELKNNFGIDTSKLPQEQIATSNVKAERIENLNIIKFIAISKILPGQQILVSYYKDYWFGAFIYKQIREKLFDKNNGTLINPLFYQYNYFYLHIRGDYISYIVGIDVADSALVMLEEILGFPSNQLENLIAKYNPSMSEDSKNILNILREKNKSERFFLRKTIEIQYPKEQFTNMMENVKEKLEKTFSGLLKNFAMFDAIKKTWFL